MNKSLRDIVADTDKQVSQSRNPLAKLYRTILLEKNITHSTIDHYLTQYLDDPTLGIPKNSKDRSSERGNLLKQLGRPTISWKIFTKGLRLLRPRHVRITLTFTDQRGVVTNHHIDLEGFDDRQNQSDDSIKNDYDDGDDED